MDEFALIEKYFTSLAKTRLDVVCGIGDDAACLDVPRDFQVLVSCDTLVSDAHFLSSWNPYDIASRAVRVNVSDIVAMGGQPTWMVLALTLPSADESWLSSFSRGLFDTLQTYDMALIGGDTTRGPLSMTLTIHGMVPKGQAVYRSGAKVGDVIYVSGELGGAALAVEYLDGQEILQADKSMMMEKLLRPNPRVDLSPYIRSFATSCIDISDGLSADLFHICEASSVGAKIFVDKVPLHPLVKKYHPKNALDFALSGGDDYELCFTVKKEDVQQFEKELKASSLICYPIGVMDSKKGIWDKDVALSPKGYTHF